MNETQLVYERMRCKIADLEKENAELEQKLEQTEKDLADYQFNYPTIKELQKENAELRNTETMLKVLKDRGVIKSWFYNGSYHVGNELPR